MRSRLLSVIGMMLIVTAAASGGLAAILRGTAGELRPVWLMAILATTLAACVASALVSLRMLEPLRAFVEAASRIGQGDLSHRIAAPRTRELRELAEEFNRMAERLHEAQMKQGEAAHEILVTIGHEMGNSLASISGAVQVLLRRPSQLPPEVLSSLRKINDTVERASRRVERLRHYAELTRAAYPGGWKMFDLDRGEDPSGGATPHVGANPAQDPPG